MTRQNLIPVNPTETPRTYRFQRDVAQILNPLILDEILRLVDGENWALVGLLYVDDGPPAEDLGDVGSFYLDRQTGRLYAK